MESRKMFLILQNKTNLMKV